MEILNEKGIYNKGKPFARNTVYKILKTEKYSGVYRCKGQVYNNIYPQIVPTNIFEIVRSKMQKNKISKLMKDVGFNEKTKNYRCTLPYLP